MVLSFAMWLELFLIFRKKSNIQVQAGSLKLNSASGLCVSASSVTFIRVTTSIAIRKVVPRRKEENCRCYNSQPCGDTGHLMHFQPIAVLLYIVRNVKRVPEYCGALIFLMWIYYQKNNLLPTCSRLAWYNWFLIALQMRVDLCPFSETSSSGIFSWGIHIYTEVI